MKTINLKQILENAHYDPSLSVEEPFNEACILEAMKDACKQVLDIAAEEVELMYLEYKKEIPEGFEEPFKVIFDELGNIYCINPDSILKIKEIL